MINDNTNRNNIKVAIVSGITSMATIVLLSLICGTKFSGWDDSIVEFLISQTNSGGTDYQGKLLIMFLHSMYKLFPATGHWMIFNVIATALSSSILVYVLIRRYPNMVGIIDALLITFISYLFSLRVLNYSRTAFITSISAFALIYQATFFDEGRVKKIEYIAGMFFVILGLEIRKDPVFFATGCFVVLVFSTFFVNGKIKKDEIVRAIVVALSICLFITINSLILTEEEREYREYNNAETAIRDYTLRYPEWNDAYKEYEKIDISEHDFYMLTHWLTADTDFFTTDRVKAVTRLKYYNETIKSLITDPHILLWLEPIYKYESLQLILIASIALGIIGVIFGGRKYIIPEICIPAYIIACYIMLVIKGRIIDDVVFILALGYLICSMLVITSDFEKMRDVNIKKVSAWFPSVCITAVGIALGVFLYCTDRIECTPWKNDDDCPSKSSSLFKELNNDNSNTYIISLDPFAKEKDAWKGYESNKYDNIFYFGGWETRCGFLKERLQNRKINNPVRALLYNEKVYSVLDEQSCNVLAFLREHYDIKATATNVGSVGNDEFMVIKYSYFIDDEDLVKLDEYRALFSYKDGIVAKIEGDDVTTINEVYCNASINGERYTFKLDNIEEETYIGEPLDILGEFGEIELNLPVIVVKVGDEYYTLDTDLF